MTHAGFRAVSDKAAAGAKEATAVMIGDLSGGNVDAAAGRSDGMGTAELQALSDSVKSLGPVKQVDSTSFNNGTLKGTATFEKGKRSYTARLSFNEGNGWVVKSLSFGP